MYHHNITVKPTNSLGNLYASTLLLTQPVCGSSIKCHAIIIFHYLSSKERTLTMYGQLLFVAMNCRDLIFAFCKTVDAINWN
jgi:hypothetical protein